MPQWVDVRKMKYGPECAVEAVDQATVAAGGSRVASYVCSPYHAVIENIHVDPVANVDVFLGIDGIAEQMQYRANTVNPITGATVEDYWKREKYIATKSFEIMYRDATAAATNVWGRWNITTKLPSILDKLRSKQKLTSEEQQIADNLDLEDNLAVGSLPMQPSLIERRSVWPQFQKIEPIYRNLALLAANSSVTVAYDIVCPQDSVMCLLGVMTDLAVGFSDTYIIVDRDNDYDYMKMDCTALPPHETVPCYVPFTEKLTVSIDSVTGFAANNFAGFIIGTRPRTLLDHIKWGDNLPYRSEVEATEAQQLIDKYTKGLSPRENIINRVKAGLL